MTDEVVAQHPFIKECVREALSGNPDGLMTSFLFSCTPQGADFWADEVMNLSGGQSLSPQAKNYLEFLLEADAYQPKKPFFVRKYVEEALAGNGTGLSRSLAFDQTPQGREYWIKELKGLEEGGWLSESSVEYLRFLLSDAEPAPIKIVDPSKPTPPFVRYGSTSVKETWFQKLKTWLSKLFN